MSVSCGWSDDEYDDEFGLDDEGPQDSDLDDEDEDTIVVACPACGAEIPEFADYCTQCHTWVAKGGKPSRPGVLVVGLVALAIALILILLLR